MLHKIYQKISNYKIVNYYKSTPAYIRKVGDTIMVFMTFLSASSIMWGDHHYVGFTLFIIGAAAKFTSNLLTDEKKDDDKD
jgi:hypothetical protein